MEEEYGYVNLRIFSYIDYPFLPWNLCMNTIKRIYNYFDKKASYMALIPPSDNYYSDIPTVPILCLFTNMYYNGIRFRVLYPPKCSHDLPPLAGTVHTETISIPQGIFQSNWQHIAHTL